LNSRLCLAEFLDVATNYHPSTSVDPRPYRPGVVLGFAVRTLLA
jgi:hypothetical protein